MSKLLSIDERVADGMVLLSVCDFGHVFRGQLWASCKARKSGRCDASGDLYKPGALVYRPIGSPQNRMMRILASAIEGGAP